MMLAADWPVWTAPFVIVAVVGALALPVWLVVTVGRVAGRRRLAREVAIARLPETYSEAVAVDPRLGRGLRFGRGMWTARSWETGRLVLDQDLRLRFDGPQSGFDASVLDVVRMEEVGATGMRLTFQDGRQICFDVSPQALHPSGGHAGLSPVAAQGSAIRFGWMRALAIAQRFAQRSHDGAGIGV